MKTTLGPGRPKLPKNQRLVYLSVGVPPSIATWLEAEARRRGVRAVKVHREILATGIDNIKKERGVHETQHI